MTLLCWCVQVAAELATPHSPQTHTNAEAGEETRMMTLCFYLSLTHSLIVRMIQQQLEAKQQQGSGTRAKTSY